MAKDKQKDKIEEEIIDVTDEIIEQPDPDPIDVLSAELAASKEQLLRLAAEYDNFRKRSKKERENIFADAFALAVTSFLPLLDAFDNAQRNADADDGVMALIKLSDEILKRMNIETINPENEPFDAELHNAVMHVEDENYGENAVAEVFQKGYKIGEKVIRHATVKVAN